MKKLVFSFFFIPVLSWAQPKKLVLLLAEMPPGEVCEILGPPPACKQQIGPNFTLALKPVKLQVITTDMSCNIIPVTGWEARVGVVDPDLLPFLCGDIREDRPWAACTTFEGTTSVTIKPWRATIWQQPIAPNDPGTFPKLITEYRFVVEHVVHPGQDTMLPDTSSPLDSVIPNPPDSASKLLIILPGEKHYPGDNQNWPDTLVGKRGIPINLWAAKFYDFWVLGTDPYYNIVWAPPPQDSVFLSDSTCPTLLVPDSVDPRAAWFCTPIPGPDTLVDSIAKKLYRVRWGKTGKACLKAFGTGIQSGCEYINVTGDPPTPANPINVIPNPGGAPGCPVEIIILNPGQKPTKVYAKIFDSFGYLVRDFSNDIMEQMKYFSFHKPWTLKWDLKNDEGKLVKNGVYQFIVEIIMVEKAGIWREKIGVVW